jgi:hypothetical protein
MNPFVTLAATYVLRVAGRRAIDDFTTDASSCPGVA